MLYYIENVLITYYFHNKIDYGNCTTNLLKSKNELKRNKMKENTVRNKNYVG